MDEYREEQEGEEDGEVLYVRGRTGGYGESENSPQVRVRVRVQMQMQMQLD
jgi:ribosomal protein S28E/S33